MQGNSVDAGYRKGVRGHLFQTSTEQTAAAAGANAGADAVLLLVQVQGAVYQLQSFATAGIFKTLSLLWQQNCS